MSDYRDPRDPIHRDPIYGSVDEPAVNRARSDAYGSGMLWGWLVGILLLVGILVFAFGGSDDTQTARIDNQPATPPPATKTEPGSAPPAARPETPPAAQPEPAPNAPKAE